MRFHLRPELSNVLRRLRISLSQLRSSRPDAGGFGAAAGTEQADLDQWVRLAAGDGGPTAARTDHKPPGDLLRRVQVVLADEEASLMPPVAAADMTQAEWDVLPDHARLRYQRKQLALIDPRLVSRSTRLSPISRWLRR